MSNFKELQIDSFKGIKNLHLRNLANINIFVSLNNASENSYLNQVRLYQITNSIEKIRVKTFNGNEAYKLRSSFGEDLR